MERRISSIGIQYLAVVSQVEVKGKRLNWSGSFPDVPGCVATGDSAAETFEHLAEALDMHLAGMAEDGDPTPEPIARAAYINRKIGFAEMGSRGGRAAASRMTPEARRERARKAGLAGGKAGGRGRPKVAAK